MVSEIQILQAKHNEYHVQGAQAYVLAVVVAAGTLESTSRLAGHISQQSTHEQITGFCLVSPCTAASESLASGVMELSGERFR